MRVKNELTRFVKRCEAHNDIWRHLNIKSDGSCYSWCWRDIKKASEIENK